MTHQTLLSHTRLPFSNKLPIFIDNSTKFYHLVYVLIVCHIDQLNKKLLVHHVCKGYSITACQNDTIIVEQIRLKDHEE